MSIANSLSVINLENLETPAIAAGEHPYCVTVSPDSRYAYVTNTQVGTVSVIDLEQNKGTGKIRVGDFTEASTMMAPARKFTLTTRFQ